MHSVTARAEAEKRYPGKVVDAGDILVAEGGRRILGRPSVREYVFVAILEEKGERRAVNVATGEQLVMVPAGEPHEFAWNAPRWSSFRAHVTVFPPKE